MSALLEREAAQAATTLRQVIAEIKAFAPIGDARDVRLAEIRARLAGAASNLEHELALIARARQQEAEAAARAATNPWTIR